MDFFYALRDERKGPVARAEIDRLRSAGTIDDETLVWHDGLPEWTELGKLKLDARAAVTVAPPLPAADSGGMKPCSACGAMWAVSMLDQQGPRLICRMCVTNQHLAASNATVRKKSPVSSIDARQVLPWVTGAAVAMIAARFIFLFMFTTTRPVAQLQAITAISGKLPHDIAMPAEKWASARPAEWPTVVLTNQAVFANSNPIGGSGAFLVQRADGSVLGVTAAHLLASVGGGTNPITRNSFNSQIKSWSLSAPGGQEKALVFNALHGAPETYGSMDLLVLEGSAKDAPAPAIPLRLQPGLLKAGDSVYIAAPDLEAATHQRIVPCRVVFGGALVVDELIVEPLAKIEPRGISGSPVLDANGHLRGVVTGGDESPEGLQISAVPAFRFEHLVK